LKVQYDELVLNFAFNFNLRRYWLARESGGGLDLTDTVADGAQLLITDSQLRVQLLMAVTEDNRWGCWPTPPLARRSSHPVSRHPRCHPRVLLILKRLVLVLTCRLHVDEIQRLVALLQDDIKAGPRGGS
jgi:hypothetical protein